MSAVIERDNVDVCLYLYIRRWNETEGERDESQIDILLNDMRYSVSGH